VHRATALSYRPANSALKDQADGPGCPSQVTVLLPSGQNMNAANLHVLSNVADDPQALLEPVSQVTEDISVRHMIVMP